MPSGIPQGVGGDGMPLIAAGVVGGRARGSQINVMQNQAAQKTQQQTTALMGDDLFNAMIQSQESQQRYNKTQYNRYAPVSRVGVAESLWDAVSAPFARKKMQEDKKELFDQQQAYQQRQLQAATQKLMEERKERKEQILPVIQDTFKNMDPKAQEGLALQWAASDSDPKEFLKYVDAEMNQDADVRNDRNGVPRYVGGSKNGEAVFPDVEATPNTQQTLSTEKGLRGEFNKLIAPYQMVNQAYGRVKVSAKNPSAAGDLSLIFNYMKMLDPGSTIREGEFATAQNSTSVPGRIQARYNQLMNGERLAVDQRVDFVDRADSLYQAAKDNAAKTAQAYTLISTKAGVDVDSVIANFSVMDTYAPPEAKALIPPEAIEYLKQHPEQKEAFKAKYGSLPEGVQ